MVFPSVSIYLDPSNWNQQQSQTQQADPVTNTNNGTTTGFENHAIQLPPVNLAPNVASQSDPFAIAPSTLNRVPHPEPGLKCPRCNCTNTKFCYFNNYSLSQPRHFCRTCRRYWTRGGTLRNVPVGGGSRRNSKRNKSSSSNATAAQTGNNQVPSNVHRMGLSSLGTNIGMGNLGLGFSGVQMQMQMQQQFPFVRGLDTNTVAMQMATMNSRFNLNSRNVEGLGGDNGTGGAGNNGGWNIGRSGFDPSSNCSNVFP